MQQGTLNADAINNIFTKVENFINGGISDVDIDKSKKWVKEKHVVRPEFYTAPSPRTLLVSSDVAYRKENNPSFDLIYTDDMTLDFTPIPGLCATVYCDLNADESISTQTGHAFVTATWTCHGKHVALNTGTRHNPGNHTGHHTGTPANLNFDDLEHDDVDMAVFRLIVNGTTLAYTERTVFFEYGHYSIKNLSITARVQLKKGMNNIGVAIKPRSVSSSKKNTFYQTLVGARNMHIEIIYR